MANRNKKRFIFISIMFILLVASFFWTSGEEVNPTKVENPEEKINIVVNEDYIDKMEKENLEKDKLRKERLDKIREENKKKDELLKELPEDKKELVKKSQEKSPEEIARIKERQAKEKQEIIASSNNNGPKDKYQTDPIPSGRPKPVEPENQEIDKTKTKTVTLSVSCKSILNNMHLFNMDKIDVLPTNGIIYARKEVSFYDGESVFDVLLREMQKNKIHMDFETNPAYNTHYLKGINNIYEYDCGQLSGWMYRVNGWFPNYGVSRYELKDGDVIDILYSCDLGRDIGGGN